MEKFDVIIIGGGTAGLSAALTLGRSRKRTLVCGSGAPRNALSPEAHNFFTRDGTSPMELLRIGHEQLVPYGSVEFRPEQAVHAYQRDDIFEVTLESGAQVEARRLLLATGVTDELPAIEGLQELWGVSALHCPYCHGWEVQDEPIALLGNGEVGFDLAILIKGWSHDLVLCTDGIADLTEEQRLLLLKNNIPVREERIACFEGKDGHLETIVFEDGSVLSRSAIFLRAPQRQRSNLPELLGCDIEGSFVKVDMFGRTSVRGIYAAGDMGTPMHQLSHAAYTGVCAGTFLNKELLDEDFNSTSDS